MDPRHDCVTTRLAGAADARGIACVHVLTWRVTYADMLPASVLAAQTIGARASFWQHVLTHPGARHTCLVAASPDGIVGFATGGPARMTGENLADYDAEIYAIYLLPAWQRRGLGRRLLGAVATPLLDAAFAGAYLWVLAANTSARGFYAAMGGCEVSSRHVRMGCAVVEEVAYGWRDLTRLATNR